MSASESDVVRVRIRIDVTVPTGGRPATVTVEPTPAVMPRPKPLAPMTDGHCPGLVSSVPSNGSGGYPVQPGPGSGSGPNIGTIAAQAQLDGPADEVRAIVGRPGDPPPPPPCGVPMTENPPGSNNWEAAAVPGAANSSGGAGNVLLIYPRVGNVWCPPIGVNFTGVPAAGSGMRTKHRPIPTYPAVWCVAVVGFADGPLAAFNSLWALRQAAGCGRPTWDNRGHEDHAGRVRLVLDPSVGWELTLCRGGHTVRYALPAAAGDSFGPLRFADQRCELPKLGPVDCPAVDVSAM